MAGHSKFKNIMHRKGAQDKKRAKLFTKLGREITISAKSGTDINFNPRLRHAIDAAKAANMPKDNINTALAKALQDHSGDNYDEVRYEGYGPGGVAVIVEAFTDNRNRTASDIRSTFTKYGGSLGETGSLSFLFKKTGVIRYETAGIDYDTLMTAVLDSEADDLVESNEIYEIYCQPEKFHAVLDYITEKFGQSLESGLEWLPHTIKEIDNADMASKLLKFIGILEDNDDVQLVSYDFKISDEILETLDD